LSHGFIYILVNASLPYIKIGRTERRPELRAQELSTTGVPTPFRVAYKLYVDNCEEIERKAHFELSEYRVSNNREFFEVELTTAVGVIEQLTASTEEGNVSIDEFDPLELINQLAMDRLQECKEETEAKKVIRNFLTLTFEMLRAVNGRQDDQGWLIHFDLREDEEEIQILQHGFLPETSGSYLERVDLRTGPSDRDTVLSWEKESLEIAYSYHGDTQWFKYKDQLSDPKKLTQSILTHSVFGWATEEEEREVLPTLGMLNDFVLDVWRLYLKSESCAEYLNSHEEADGRAEEIAFIEGEWVAVCYWEPVVQKWLSEKKITERTSERWINVLRSIDGSDAWYYEHQPDQYDFWEAWELEPLRKWLGQLKNVAIRLIDDQRTDPK